MVFFNTIIWINKSFPDITWLTVMSIGVQNLRHQNRSVFICFVQLPLSGSNTPNSHCSIKSWNKIRWKCQLTSVTATFYAALSSDSWALVEFKCLVLTRLVCCASWCAWGIWDILFVIVGMMVFRLPYHSILRLCLHFPNISPANKGSALIWSGGQQLRLDWLTYFSVILIHV